MTGLQSAFHINHLLELHESFQKVENPAVTLQEAAPTDVNPVKKARHCFDHEGKELELYCETCGELICNKCALKGGKHHDHVFMLILVDINLVMVITCTHTIIEFSLFN